MTPGKIVIKEKVYFEPKGLKKPNKKDYEVKNPNHLDVLEITKRKIKGVNLDSWQDGFYYYHGKYQKAMKAYEASKQLIEVIHVKKIDKKISQSKPYKLKAKKGDWVFWIKNTLYVAIDNQSCEAEVKDNKAIIIELTKI